MSTGGDVSEQIVRDGMVVFEELAKIAGGLAKEAIALLAALIKREREGKGPAPVTKLKDHALKTGQELKIFQLKKEDIPAFKKLAKEYGVLYHKPIFPPVFLTKDGEKLVDMVGLSGDAHGINHALEKLGYPVPERDDEKNAAPRAASEQSSPERGSGYERSKPSRSDDAAAPAAPATEDAGEKLPASALGKIDHYKKVASAQAAAKGPKAPKAPVKTGKAR